MSGTAYFEDDTKIDDYKPKHAKKTPPVVFQLDKDVSPDFQAVVAPAEPIEAGPSILDNKIADLEAMDINKLRAQLLDEVMVLEKVNPEYRKAQLQKIFSKLIAMQPDTILYSSDEKYANQEQRLYADLISTPGLSKISYVREFLENDFYVVKSQDRQKKRLINKIYEYYDTHTQESIDKFNYVFRSSDGVSADIMHSDIELEDYFSDRVMSSFRKEDLSQMFRFSFYHDTDMRDNLHMLFSLDREKTLFMVSQMTKTVNNSIGHSAEIFEALLQMVSYNGGSNNFVSLLDDVYDQLIGSKENEESFAETLANNPDFVVVKELINYVVFDGYDKRLSTNLFESANTLEKFLNAVETYRSNHHRDILGDEGMAKLKSGTFDSSVDFPPITDAYELDLFKEALLYNLYGISVDEASHLKQHYGKYMDVLMQGIPAKPDGMSDEEFLASLDEDKMTIMKKDYSTLQMFKAINAIYSLNVRDKLFQEKLEVLREAYLVHVKEKGFDKQIGAASAIIVEGLLNNMFMNSYNKRLISTKDEHPVLKVDDGITLLDAGVEFDMIVSSLSGVGDFFDGTVNMASKWNTASLASGQGICTSHISGQNLGVISLEAPLLGFNRIPGIGLNAMGTTDIYTGTNRYNLRAYNDSRDGQNRFFVPGSVMSNETRYGYNEILLDRFMMQDENNHLKLQPNYLVFYKMSDQDYKYNQLYLKTKKMAKDFGVPIMVVDIPKIKEHERGQIKDMEEELFGSDVVDKQLVTDIVTRYMNNYTGSLTITANSSCGWQYPEDFSIDGIRTFYAKAVEKIGSIEDEEVQKQWLEALESAYKLERKRYKEARSVSSYKNSVTSFLLDDLGIRSQLKAVRYDLEQGIGPSSLDDTLKGQGAISEDDWKTAELPKVVPPEDCPTIELADGNVGVFVMDEKYSPEVQTIIGLTSAIAQGSTFSVIDSYVYEETKGKLVVGNISKDNEILLVENLIVSYFLENCEIAPVDSLDEVMVNGMKTSVSNFDDYDWNKEIMASPYKEILFKGGEYEFIPLSAEKLTTFVSSIESMSEEKFIAVFSPIIAATAKKTGETSDIIAERFLDKKENIGPVFERLQRQVQSLNGGEDVVSIGEDNKGKR